MRRLVGVGEMSWCFEDVNAVKGCLYTHYTVVVELWYTVTGLGNMVTQDDTDIWCYVRRIWVHEISNFRTSRT